MERFYYKSYDEWLRAEIFPIINIDYLYVIVGCLNQYHGGYELDDEIVCRMYVCDIQNAKLLKNICEKYLKSQDMENDVELVENEFLCVKSKTICKKIKEIYSVEIKEHIYKGFYEISKEDGLFKSPEDLYGGYIGYVNEFNHLRYSYLIGILLTHKESDSPTLKFVNAGDKIKLITDIIKDFSAFGDNKFSIDYILSVPRITRIKLSENNVIWEELAKYKTQFN